MKTTIEYPLNFDTRTNIGLQKAVEFEMLLKHSIWSNSEDSLRYKISDYNYKHFKYGFGHTHMWVHEKGSEERLLIVEF